jgi:hypothetical protein
MFEASGGGAPPVGNRDGKKVVALGANAAAGRQDGEEVLLGHLFWYSVPDSVRLTPGAFGRALREAGLPEGLAPSQLSPAAALSRAAEGAETKGVRLLEDRQGNPLGGADDVPEDEPASLYANVLVRTAARGVKQVVTEILDAGSVRLSYAPLAKVRAEDKGLEVEPLTEEPLLRAEQDAMAELHRLYEFERERHDAEDVRRLMGRLLRAANAIPMRNSGALYFVPEDRAADGKRLLDLVGSVARTAESAPGRRPASVSQAARVELVDRQEYRDWIHSSLDEFVSKEAQALVKEMAALLKGENTVTDRRKKSLAERTKALRSSVEQYEELLETRSAGARADLDLVARQFRKLLDT